MTIVYTCDNNFVWIMGISMISLCENNRNLAELEVYLLGDHISEENKRTLSGIAKRYNRVCRFIDVPDLDIPHQLTSNRWPKSAFTRIFSGELMPKDIHKVLYLDCDTIVKGNISKLEDFDTNGHVISAVKDCVSWQYKKKIGLSKNDSYVNAGVLLIDLDRLRQMNIRQMMSDFVLSHYHLISYADQDILNGMFKGKFGALPPEYNAMTQVCAYSYKQILQYRRPSAYYTEKEIENAQHNPIVIHFTTCMLNVRPWLQNSNHPWAAEFDRYQSLSPWASRPKGIARFDKKEHKIIRGVLALPDCISYRLIGLLHAVIRPMAIMALARFNREKKTTPDIIPLRKR